MFVRIWEALQKVLHNLNAAVKSIGAEARGSLDGAKPGSFHASAWI